MHSNVVVAVQGRVFILSMEENKKVKSVNEREQEIIKFWKESNIFQKSLEKDAPMGEYVFYDGPPTANGRPGIHHLEARAFKDAIPRYKTMRGYHVRRKAGWDTHGLPVELEVEKQLGLTSKKQIEEYGIGKFNAECKKSVWKYIDEWEKFTDRSAYWIDLQNPYITYQPSYIESLWSVMAEVEKQGLLYKDYRIVPWCSRCGTALSSHELAQGYQDVKDLSVYAKFKVIGQENTYLLAWTTTPWTLPGNVALAVNEKLEYVKVRKDDSVYILGKDRVLLFEGEYEILDTIKGSELVGIEYEPLYQYFANTIQESEKEKLEKAYKVYAADFVTAEDGTGIVHTAVMYGQDDFELGTKLGLPKYHLVNEDGHFKDGMDFLSGRFVKDEEVAIDIIKDLAHRGLLFKKEKYEHSYPHCWRCKTPLIYYARDSWYIRISELRNDLVKNNQLINWEPAHTKEGRFGEWIADVKDWAISRERYWGTPLPVWEDASGKRYIFSSREELAAHTKKSGNAYIVVRHGEARHNVENRVNYADHQNSHLTEKGKAEVQNLAQTLKDEGITRIICSPFVRAKETAEIIAGELGISIGLIEYDARIGELNPGVYDGKTWAERNEWAHQQEHFYTAAPVGGESHLDAKKRFGEFLYEINAAYANEKVLIVTHGIGIEVLPAVAGGADLEISQQIYNDASRDTGAVIRLDFTPLPHNENYELDLHRPYIDEYPVFDEEGNKLTRTKEVMDVWFDSGAMPFAQDGYPRIADKVYYPADYICEAIDQTRGWFYTLHAVGALLGRGPAYKNVICLGHILDKEGQKMSKSKGNVVNPWDMFEKYGADTLRFWMYSVNQPGDSKNFDEKTVDEIVKKVFNLVRNVYAFYDLYRAKNEESSYEDSVSSMHPLDQWILCRLSDLISVSTRSLDAYSLFVPARAIREFVDELSTWYVRRSRERLRIGEQGAKQTLYVVLKTLAKVMAPLTPFIAEELWQDLRVQDDTESVHLAPWPESFTVSNKEEVYQKMDDVRRLATAGNALRKTLGIPVRQPLSAFFTDVEIGSEYAGLLKEELNVKNIQKGESIDFDRTITEALKDEGNFRELVRFVQDTRKKMSLTAGQAVRLFIQTDAAGREFVDRFEAALLEEVSASSVSFEDTVGEEAVIDAMRFIIRLEVL